MSHRVNIWLRGGGTFTAQTVGSNTGPSTRRDRSMSHQSSTPICDHLRAAGDWNPAWDQMAEMDPDWVESFIAMGVKPRLRDVLEPKVWELIAIAVDASC